MRIHCRRGLRRTCWVAVALAALVVWCLAGAAAAVAGPLSVVGSGQQALKIELDHGAEGKLVGHGHLVLRNDGESQGVVHLEYVSQHGAEPSDLKLAPVAIPAHGLAAVAFDAELPPGSDPVELGGIARLRLESQGKTVSEPLDLTIEGVGPSFADVSIVPSTLALHSVNWAGPLGHAKSASISVELTGAGVPGLFRGGATQFTSHTLLRSSTGRELEATLTAAPPAGTDTIARGEVRVTGSLAPGSYTGTLPLSSLASSGAPSVGVTTESSDSFLWAMLVVGLGALAGGGVYLASGIKRRKDLMEAEVKEALERYRRKRDERTEKSAAALWTPSGLGEERKWFVRRWTSLPQLDGVQGVWSQIYWARNEGDLDEVQKLVEPLVARLLRWLEVASDPGPQLLHDAFELAPRQAAESVWRKTHTYRATAELLGRAAEREPADDKEIEQLVEELNRQARWHSRFATLWDLKSQVLADASKREASYTDGDRKTLKEIDLGAIDEDFANVTDPTKQIDLEVEVDGEASTLLEMATSKDLAVRPIEGPDKVVELGADDYLEVARQGIAPAVKPSVATAAINPMPGATAQPRGRRRSPERTEGTPAWLRELLARDALWSIVVVIVALAVYVPVFYGPTWGNLGDYAGAFVAGFVGKVAINWAALPVFRSLSARAKTPELKELVPDAVAADPGKLLPGVLNGAPRAAAALNEGAVNDGAGAAEAPAAVAAGD